MALAIMFFTTLFAVDNTEFFETVEQNQKDGMSWHYVGKNGPDGQPAITLRNEATGEEYIYFKMLREE